MNSIAFWETWLEADLPAGKVWDTLEENNRQRFLVRRAAEQKRASASAMSRAQGLPMADKPEFADARSRAAMRTPLGVATPSPWPLIVVAVGGLWLVGLAVIGAWTLIRAVFGS